jgi:hypothetical protein
LQLLSLSPFRSAVLEPNLKIKIFYYIEFDIWQAFYFVC